MVETFLKEKQYLDNVSPATIVLYRSCFKAFDGATDSIEQVKQRIVELRNRGVSPVTVNTYLRHIKCFYKWQGRDWPLKPLKEEKKLIQTLSADDIRRVINGKPVNGNLTRVRLIALTILDTGLRASEVLGLTKSDLDIDNLVFKVSGKGGKQRLVPFSAELRKHLFRLLVKDFRNNETIVPKTLLFGTKNNTKLSVRNFERDLKKFGQQIGLVLRPHLLRHSFSVNYLRAGGNLEFLRRILGHSSILTTQKYLRGLGVQDLCQAHQSLSPLAR